MTVAWDLLEPAMLAEASRRSFIYRKNPPRIERSHPRRRRRPLWGRLPALQAAS
jgi:hypothetical protein